MAQLKMKFPDGSVLEHEDPLAGVGITIRGRAFVQQVEEYSRKWLPRILEGASGNERVRPTKALTKALLRQVFCDFYDNKYIEETTKQSEAINKMRDRYIDLIQTLNNLERHADRWNIELMGNLKEMLEDQVYVAMVKQAYCEKRDRSSDYWHKRMIIDLWTFPGAMQVVARWSLNKWENQIAKTGRPSAEAPFALVSDLLRFLHTVQEKVPQIASAVTVDNFAGKEFRKKPDTVKRYEFINEGLEIAGVKLSTDRLVKKIKSEFKKIDWASEDARLRLKFEITEEFRKRRLRSVSFDPG